MGRNQRYGGDMTSDWGGQGSAKIRNNDTCGALGTDSVQKSQAVAIQQVFWDKQELVLHSYNILI